MPTERERMLAGDLYLASDPELVAARLRARRLTREFNATTENQPSDRARILAELFGALGDRAEIEPPFHCDYGFNIRAGDGLFMNFGCIALDCAPITFGHRGLVGPGVHFYAATHPTDPAVRATGRELARPITIGNDVWIGGRAVVSPGVAVGDGAVIGAGSIVPRDVPPGVVIAGNPARILRQAGPDRPERPQ